MSNANSGKPTDALQRIRTLPCWPRAPESIEPLSGGITNQNFLVTTGGERYVVRLGGDIPVNHVMRFNEHAASRAAAALGLSPAVRHSESDILVIDYIPSAALTPEQVRGQLPAILELMQKAHRDMGLQLRGPAMSYWIFHIVQDNIHTLRGFRFAADLDTLERQARELAAAVGPIELLYCHNDWLSANILDDGKRLWLIDWDYAGFNSPLSDLGSLASNNQLAREQERWLLEAYDQRPVLGQRWRAYLAMKAVSLLKETLWSMVSECVSKIDFDYANYSRTNLARYQTAWDDFTQA